MDLSVNVVETGGELLVQLRGELDIATSEELARVLAQADTARVTVEVSDLTFVDARGLAILVSARQSLAAHGRYLTVRGARGVVRRVLTAAGLRHLMED